MQFIVVILVVISVTTLTSIDCCDEFVQLYGRAGICEKNLWCRDGVWSDRAGVIQNVFLDGTTFENATFVKIYPYGVSETVKTCSVQNFQRLEIVYGESQEISAIENSAFWNLPALKSIYLAFNLLKEVRFGVFSGLPVTMVDLSWNKIVSVEANAFVRMHNLKVLNLGHNELVAFDLLPHKNLPIKELILSHNFLESVDINPHLNITLMDLSFNKMRHFVLPYNKIYKKVDLTNNYISMLKLSGGVVEDLRLSLNNLTDKNLITKSKTCIKNITLFPNPWDCKKVNVLLKCMKKRKVNVLPPDVDQRLTFAFKNYPICADTNSDALQSFHNTRGKYVKHEEVLCKNDSQCPHYMICRTGTCWDPCKSNACQFDTQPCETKNHIVECKCPPDHLSRPSELFTSLFNVTCFPTFL